MMTTVQEKTQYGKPETTGLKTHAIGLGQGMFVGEKAEFTGGNR